MNLIIGVSIEFLKKKENERLAVSVDPLFPNTPTDRSLRTDTILSISTAGQYIRKGSEGNT